MAVCTSMSRPEQRCTHIAVALPRLAQEGIEHTSYQGVHESIDDVLVEAHVGAVEVQILRAPEDVHVVPRPGCVS